MNTQIYSYSQTPNIAQPPSNSVNFNNQHKNKVKITNFLNKRKVIQIDTILKSTSFLYTNYFPSEDEEYYNQNQQRFYSSQRPRSYSIDQPDIFTYTRNEQIRQTKKKSIFLQ